MLKDRLELTKSLEIIQRNNVRGLVRQAEVLMKLGRSEEEIEESYEAVFEQAMDQVEALV